MNKGIKAIACGTMLFAAVGCQASGADKAAKLFEAKSVEELLTTKKTAVAIDVKDLDVVRTKLWEKFKKEQSAVVQRQKEHKEKKIGFNGKFMKYDYSKIGKMPANGYPLYIAQHGGGGAPSRVNDGQWKHMKVYYKANVKDGIYLAPRGMTDTWNLHFVNEAYVAYDRLIENMILFENVDPNRVYILGFSAGGDGTYRIAPKMADRWAAANMSAGHPGGVRVDNLYNLPFMLQVGEFDRAYGRHQQAPIYNEKLNDLQRLHPKGYVHEINVHINKPHNFSDNHPKEAPQNVWAEPVKMLKYWQDNKLEELLKKNKLAEFKKLYTKAPRKVVKRNTSAIAWMNQYTRNPLPTKVIWDLKERAKRSGVTKDGKELHVTKNRGQQSYWLDLGERTHESVGEEIIIARFDKPSNTVTVEKCGSYLKVLLNNKMVDFSKPVVVKIGDKKFKVKVKPSLKNMIQTLADRGDKNYIFEGAVVITKKDNKWNISSK